MSTPNTEVATPGEMSDKLAIAELVRLERFYRDSAQWDKLAACYTEDSRVRTTWFEGSGQDFAEGSRKMAERGRLSTHLVTPTCIRVKGERALCESLMEIHNRGEIEGVEVDTIMYGRFFSRVRRTGEGWRLVSFDGIYRKDVIAPVVPGQPVPIEWQALAHLRPSYRIWAYMMSRRGYRVTGEELGDDRPDLLQAFYRAAEQWLESGR
ncbi:MAG: nuclear transport factor 2 family protein [Burkholderiales bacterium]|nr:nuclear transport factor 2 family protein [Burkholderiales bacterium]